jgi:type II secretory pathway predicted ATPase ExeA
MYEAFYGLRELPFELTPNPRFLFMTQQHREALSILQYGLSMSKPLILLVGEAGMGKTTLIRTALESEECRRMHCVYLCNPSLTRKDFVRTLADHFQLGAAAAESKQTLLRELEGLLRDRKARGEKTALVVDEAQSLSTPLYEEIRLLANIETSSEKLLPVVLAGQPELAARLEDPALRQLKQRVALRCEIRPFTSRETAAYIANRIRTAGGSAAKLFSLEAVEAIHRHSGGIPRVINVICDNALVTGVAMQRQPVDQAMILEVCRDFALAAPVAAEAPAVEERLDDLSSEAPTGTLVSSREPKHESAGRLSGVSALRRLLSFDGTRW